MNACRTVISRVTVVVYKYPLIKTVVSPHPATTDKNKELEYIYLITLLNLGYKRC